MEDLIGLVEELCSTGFLNNGLCNSLINKLNIATAMLNDQKPTPAINVIELFIHEVEAMMSGNNPVLTYEQGQPLMDGACGRHRSHRRGSEGCGEPDYHPTASNRSASSLLRQAVRPFVRPFEPSSSRLTPSYIQQNVVRRPTWFPHGPFRLSFPRRPGG